MTKMTPQQEAHLQSVKDWFVKAVNKKYRSGQREHSGNLWLKPGVLDMMEEEVIDLAVYVHTLKQQIEELRLDLVVKPQDKEND